MRGSFTTTTSSCRYHNSTIRALQHRARGLSRRLLYEATSEIALRAFIYAAAGIICFTERKHASESAESRQRQHDVLLQESSAALEAGEAQRAYLLADRAYACWRNISTLLLLAELRAELGEVGFVAAVYHSMLRVLPEGALPRSVVPR